MSDWPPRSAADAPQRGDGAPATRVVHAGLPRAEQGEPFLPGPRPRRAVSPQRSERRLALRLRALREPVLVGVRGRPRRARRRRGRALRVGDGGGRRGAHGRPERGRRRRRSRRLLPRRAHDRRSSSCARAGSRCGVVATDEDAIRAALPGASLVWVETPSNPGLDVLDVAALAADAHAAGALLAVDNTLATPLTQRPLELGADLSVASASKLLSGTPISCSATWRSATRSGRRRCGRGAASPARSPARWRRGSRTARSRRSTSATSASARRRCGSPRRSRPATTSPACATRACAAHPAHALRGVALRRALRLRRVLRPRDRGARAGVPRRVPARRRGDELRRRPQLRRAAPALGHRRRLARLHPPEHRHRGRRRPHRRRPRRARRDRADDLRRRARRRASAAARARRPRARGRSHAARTARGSARRRASRGARARSPAGRPSSTPSL